MGSRIAFINDSSMLIILSAPAHDRTNEPFVQLSVKSRGKIVQRSLSIFVPVRIREAVLHFKLQSCFSLFLLLSVSFYPLPNPYEIDIHDEFSSTSKVAVPLVMLSRRHFIKAKQLRCSKCSNVLSFLLIPQGLCYSSQRIMVVFKGRRR